MQRMKTLSEQPQEETTQEEMAKRFEKVESQTIESKWKKYKKKKKLSAKTLAPDLPRGTRDSLLDIFAVSAGRQQMGIPKADISRFIEDPGFQYQDFAKRGEVSDIPTFRVQVNKRDSTLVFCDLFEWGK